MRLASRFHLPFRRRHDPGSWSLVSTVKGEPEVILPFVAHHLQSGCKTIHLYLDSPNLQLAALLAPLERVRVTTCDPAWWAAVGGRPEGLVLRQMTNCVAARRETRSEWLIHIDSDEFLIAADGGKPAPESELAALGPGRTDWARIPHYERVLRQGQAQTGLYDGLFLDQVRDPAMARQIYGPDLPFLNRGFSGHVRGKIALRVDSALVPALHHATRRGQSGGTIPDAELPPFALLNGTKMLHFDGYTARHWIAKLLGRHSWGAHRRRLRQTAYLTEAATEAEQLALFERLQCVGPMRERALREAGLLHDIGFDPVPALAAVFPELDLSLSAADFDRRRSIALAGPALPS